MKRIGIVLLFLVVSIVAVAQAKIWSKQKAND